MVLGARGRSRVHTLTAFRAAQSIEAAINAFLEIGVDMELLLVYWLRRCHWLHFAYNRFRYLTLSNFLNLHAGHEG